MRQKKENYGQLRYYRAGTVFRHERDAAVSHLQVIVSVWAETGLNLEDSSQKNKKLKWDGSGRRDEDIAQQAWIKAEEVMSTSLLYLNVLSYVSGALQMTVATDCR